MDSAKSLETLYNLIQEIKGPLAAKNFISDVVFSAIDELQSEGISVTQESIDKKLSIVARDFLEASKNKNHVA